MWQFTNDLPMTSRLDKRKQDKYRDILINWGSIDTANGSAIVKIGNTTAVSGVTFEKSAIKIDDNHTRDQIEIETLSNISNLIDIKVRFQPYCSFGFKIQANDQDTKESLIMSRHFKHIIENARIFDLKQMISQSEQSVIVNRMLIEILIENYDGNGFDASNITLIASLIDCKLNDNKRLQIDNYPISTTFCFKQIIHDDVRKEIIFQDPSLDDEKLSNGIFNITVNADTNRLILVSKSGGEGIDLNVFKECIKVSCGRAKAIKSLLKSKQTKF